MHINNNITEEAADNTAAVIHNNKRLQKLQLSCNDFKAAGTIKIVKSLQRIPSLSEFHINNSSKEVADDIAAFILSYSKLQQIQLSWNDFEAAGTIK